MKWETETELFRNTYRTTGDKFKDYMHQCYQKREFPLLVWREIAKHGLFGITVNQPKAKALKLLAAAYEGFAYGSQDLGFFIAPVCHGAMAIPILNQHASTQAREKYLPGAINGSTIISFAVTESGSGGTDAYHHDCQLANMGSKKILNGKKWHITSAPYADLFMVWAKDVYGSMVAVLVEKNWEGVKASEPLQCVGARTSPVGTIEFKNVEVPPENIIRFKSGKRILMDTLMIERVIGTFAGIGMIQQMIEKCMTFVRSRRVGNTRLDQHQYMQLRITNMQAKLTQLEALCHSTLALLCEGNNVDLESSVLKPFAAEAVFLCAKEAGQICASYGLQEEAQLYSALLDSWCTMVGGGTEEAHRMIVWQKMKRRYNGRALVIDNQNRHIWEESQQILDEIQSVG
jgi:isovaleryl-CoA dehydrogenase